MCRPKGRVFAVLGAFWSENGYRLAYFGLESGMVFEGTTEVLERIISKTVKQQADTKTQCNTLQAGPFSFISLN